MLLKLLKQVLIVPSHEFVEKETKAEQLFTSLFISAVVGCSEIQPGGKSGRDQSRAAGCPDKPC